MNGLLPRAKLLARPRTHTTTNHDSILLCNSLLRNGTMNKMICILGIMTDGTKRSKIIEKLKDDWPGTHYCSDSHVNMTLEEGMYVFTGVKHSIITIPKDTLLKKLVLDDCEAVEINCCRAPIVGLSILNCRRIKVNINTQNTSSTSSTVCNIDIYRTVVADIISDGPCRIEVDRSRNVLCNEENISDCYCDSTWEL